MKVINAGLVLVMVAIGFFATDNLKLNRIRQVMFERANTNINMDIIAVDVLDEAIVGIDENGDAMVSLKRADIVYAGLVGKNLREIAADSTAFMVHTGADVPDDNIGEALEKEVLSQIKTVNKRLNYSFLFTEKTNSFFYNPIGRNSVYIMYLPKFANLIRLGNDNFIYSLSGAKLE